MKRIIATLFLILPILFPTFVSAYTKSGTSPGAIYYTDGSQSDVQNAIDDATGAANYADGDVIDIPADTFTWASGITIDKGITLRGQGHSSTRINTTMSTAANLYTSQGFRITGIYWNGNSSVGDHFMRTNLSGLQPQNFRIDNCYFDYGLSEYSSTRNAILLYVGSNYDHPSGVIDHNTFRGWRILNSGAIYCHQQKMAEENRLGNTNTVFVENNTFTYPYDGSQGKSAVELHSGGSMVFRYNTVESMFFHAHHSGGGTYDCPRRASGYWEIYGNTFENLNASMWMYSIRLRGGTGMVFDNEYLGGYTGNRIPIDNEGARTGDCDGGSAADGNDPAYAATAPGYPCRDQIGWGRDYFAWVNGASGAAIPDQESEPASFWNNTGFGDVYIYDSTDDPYIVQNRDYYDDESGTDTHMQSGLLAAAPATCDQGDRYWATDQGGNWNTDTVATNDGRQYRCDGSNNWVAYYTPHQFPHPLTTGTSLTTWYEDADGDGYHASNTQSAATDPGATWYLLGDLDGGGDCDDNDAAESPALAEICWDGLDNDCDGYVDGVDSECGTGGKSIVVKTTSGAAIVPVASGAAIGD